MEIGLTKVVNVQAKTLSMCIKVRDNFCASILDENGITLGEQDDIYVPSFMPGEHFGDYVMLDIDLDTGLITNWKKPTAEQIELFISGGLED